MSNTNILSRDKVILLLDQWLRLDLSWIIRHGYIRNDTKDEITEESLKEKGIYWVLPGDSQSGREEYILDIITMARLRELGRIYSEKGFEVRVYDFIKESDGKRRVIVSKHHREAKINIEIYASSFLEESVLKAFKAINDKKENNNE